MPDIQNEPIQLNGLYRHFKGNYYVVSKIATNEKDKVPYVIYTDVTSNQTYARPFEDFIADVSNREDNVTHQVHRFELAKELKGLLSLTPTEELVNELRTRPDNPYEGFQTLEEDKDVWAVQYLLGRVIQHPETDTEEEYEEFVPITPASFSDYTSAKKYRENFYANKPCVIARRITRKVKEF